MAEFEHHVNIVIVLERTVHSNDVYVRQLLVDFDLASYFFMMMRFAQTKLRNHLKLSQSTNNEPTLQHKRTFNA